MNTDDVHDPDAARRALALLTFVAGECMPDSDPLGGRTTVLRQLVCDDQGDPLNAEQLLMMCVSLAAYGAAAITELAGAQNETVTSLLGRMAGATP